jgi:putative heme-binding domain-containing protein
MSRRRMSLLAFWPNGLNRILSSSSVAAFLVFTMHPIAAQNPNPYSSDATAAKAGEFEFRINCALCHGLGARGGGRGPDLTRAHKRHGDSDGDLFRNISQGIPGTAMPANGTNGQGVGMTDQEIWQIITYLRSVQAGRSAKKLGNAANGRKLFYGDANCSTCHMVEGKGGRVGPDLTSVGTSRTVESLVESVRNPSQRLAWGLTEPTKEFAQRYEMVTVVTPDGKEIKGVTLNEDSFSLQVIDTAEQVHLFDKDKLRSINKSRKSLMPSYNSGTLTDQDLNDIIAYLLDVAEK